MPKPRPTDDETSKTLTDAQRTAYEKGFEDWHTGGGSMAFRKDGDGRYWLITDGNGGISADPAASEWTVGCHSDDDADEDGLFKWVRVTEGVTLGTALALHDRLPDPVRPEQSVAKWADIGIDVATSVAHRR